MMEPSRISESYKAAVDSTLPIVRKTAVTVITDTHFYIDDVHSYAIEMAKATGRPLILESIKPATYHYVSQLEGGHITKDQFIAAMEYGSNSLGGVGLYIGNERGRKHNENLADAIQAGVKILPAGSNFSLTNDIEKMNRKEELAARITNDTNVFATNNAESIQKNPQKFAKDYSEKIRREQFPQMSPAQREAFFQTTSQKIVSDDHAREVIEDLYGLTHPAYTEYKKKGKELAATDRGHAFDLDKRLRGDDVVGKQLAETILENGGEAIVVYGTKHTTHEGKRGYDLDSILREKGLATTVIDPTVPAHEIISANTHPDFIETGMSQYAQMTKEAAAEGGPNRYSVDLRTGNVSTYASDKNKTSCPMSAAESQIDTGCRLTDDFCCAASGVEPVGAKQAPDAPAYQASFNIKGYAY